MINFQGNKKLSRHEPVSIKRDDDDGDDDDVDDDRVLHPYFSFLLYLQSLHGEDC